MKTKKEKRKRKLKKELNTRGPRRQLQSSENTKPANTIQLTTHVARTGGTTTKQIKTKQASSHFPLSLVCQMLFGMITKA
jgi:hypothetical protein